MQGGEGLLGAGDLAFDEGGGAKPQGGMRIGVVTHFMAALGDSPSNLGVTLGVHADLKEGGAGFVQRQYFQEIERAFARPVVKGEGNGTTGGGTSPA